jgi:beta-barrel assembly-enhancing protease
MRGLWCVAMLAVGVAQGQDRQPGQAVNFYNRDKEIALGQQLVLEVRQKTTLLDNAAVSDYVKRVGANLAAQFPGGWTYQIETIREDSGGATHEPGAFPGGFVFVSVDLIAAARNEAEFAGMLAHAMAHVAARHWTRQATRGQIAQIGMQAQSAAASTPDQGRGIAIPLGMLTFQRVNEREADYLAVKAMAAAGYDPAGLASYVERLQPPATGRGSVFETLPPRDERVAAIQAEIGQLPARTYETSDEFARVQEEVKLPVAVPPTLIKK